MRKWEGLNMNGNQADKSEESKSYSEPVKCINKEYELLDRCSFHNYINNLIKALAFTKNAIDDSAWMDSCDLLLLQETKDSLGRFSESKQDENGRD